jgi:hypothetical protein
MHKIINPQQTRLFDPFDSVLTEKTRKRLLDGWAGVFRHVILELMPVETISGHFDRAMGRPTKELYSMAGLLLIKEFMDWTKDEALDAYSFRMDIHYALNLEPITHDISMRTLERYMNLFEEDDLAKSVMLEIIVTLVDILDINIDKQRLDSTHIFSDMASFGRTRLMGVAIKRFLTQVIRHNKEDYNSLKESFRNRYAPGVNQLFADTKKDSESRRQLRQQVAEDMHFIIRYFGGNAEYNVKDSYKAVERIFYEQCHVHEDKVIIKKKTGGNVMQNPSDPDATYDGHKGQGYQVQISETCHPENEIQLIICALPQTAVEPDTTAISEVLDNLEESELLPQEMFADTHYCSDENIQAAAERGVELVGPVQCGSISDKGVDHLNVDDFDIDEETEKVVCCPAGHKPALSMHDKQTGKTKTVMPSSTCSQCEFCKECPIEKCRDGYCLYHTAKQRRLAGRRREENTDVFRDRYRIRGGIEGTNSGLKRKTGLGQLRVRGKPRVFHSILLKIVGWNILRVAACAKMRREIVYARANMAVFWPNFTLLRKKIAVQTARRVAIKKFLVCVQQFAEFQRLYAAGYGNF